MNSSAPTLFLLIAMVAGGCSFSRVDSSVEVAGEQAALAAQETKELDYLLAMGGGASAASEVPMLVLIHGYGGTPEKMLRSFGDVTRPTRVVSLRGDPAPGRGFVWFPVRVQDPDIARLAAGLERAGTRIASQLEVLVSRYPTLGKPVIAGFSQGGMLAIELGLKHPEGVGAAVILSGYYPPQSYPREGPGEWSPPLLSIHGTADAVLPIAYMREAITEIRGKGYPVERWEYDGMEHAMSGAAHQKAMSLIAQQLELQSAL